MRGKVYLFLLVGLVLPMTPAFPQSPDDGNTLLHNCSLVVKIIDDSSVDMLSRFRKFRQRDEWKVVPQPAIKMAETRSNNGTTSPPESHSGLQGEGGFGRPKGR